MYSKLRMLLNKPLTLNIIFKFETYSGSQLYALPCPYFDFVLLRNIAILTIGAHSLSQDIAQCE